MASDSAGIPIEEILRRFLVASASRKFNWVDCNCGFWVCEWIKAVTGNDPVEHVRGRFKTTGRFHHHIIKAGGNEAFSRSIAEQAGLVQTDNPVAGDVGLIVTGDGATMAIKAPGHTWIAKSEKGIAIGPFSCIVAWKL